MKEHKHNQFLLNQVFLQVDYYYFLQEIEIPAAVTSIGNSAFQYCYSMAELKFLGSTPPTIGGSSAFSGLPAACKIYVPSGSLSAYTSTANMPSSSTYTYIEY